MGHVKRTDQSDAEDRGRREVLRSSLYVGLLVTCGGTVPWGCSGRSDEDTRDGEGRGETSGSGGSKEAILDLEDSAYEPLKQTGGAVRVSVKEEKYPIIVFRASESRATALSAECTHQGCEVPMPKEGRIVCPCHGSTFSTTGEKISGPAASGLPTYETEVREGAIVVQGVTLTA